MAATTIPGVRSNLAFETLPMPPRINIPPLPLANGASKVPFDVDPGRILTDQDPAENIDFLNGTSFMEPLNQQPELWHYEMRRRAQQILSFIYLGPLQVVKDHNFLAQERITLVLTIHVNNPIGNMLANNTARTLERLHIAHENVFLESYELLLRAVPHIKHIFNRHLLEMHQQHASDRAMASGAILVACESGNDKSAGVVAAYLMEILSNMTDIKAIQIVQARRFCCSWDDELKRVMQTYWGLLQARRFVAAAQAEMHCKLQQGLLPSKRARVNNDDDDEMKDVGDHELGDAERFRGRKMMPYLAGD